MADQEPLCLGDEPELVLVDLVAIKLEATGRWWQRRGEPAILLGQGHLEDAARNGEPVKVFRNPLTWLRSRCPDTAAKNAAFEVFRQLDQLRPEDLGAEVQENEIPGLRFAADAQELFNEFRGQLERRLRGGVEIAPSFESHIAKYRKGDSMVVPYGTEAVGHIWLHSRCWPAWYARRWDEATEALAGLGVMPPDDPGNS
jgi:hypothetical protein